MQLGNRFVVKTIPQAHAVTIPYIWEEGELVTDERGEPVKEVLGMQVVFDSPNMEPLAGKLNKLNGVFFGSALINDRLAKKVAEKYHYGYGACLREMNMLRDTVEKLRKNPSTRRAVIPIFQPVHVTSPLEVPCWSLVQFFIRDNKLVLEDYFRSNDMWGGAPTDYYGERAMQYWVAQQLRVDVGPFIHNVGSAHIRMSDESVVVAYLKKIGKL